MAKAKRYRWVCPTCAAAKLGSSRPARNATVRFCLPCSAKAGVLVETESPVLAARSAAKRASSTAKRAAKKAREDAKWTRAGYDLRKEVARCCKAGGVRVPHELVVRARSDGSSSGRAWYSGRKIVLSVAKTAKRGRVLALVAHEVAHVVAPGAHDDAWRCAFLRLVREVYGVDAGDPGGSSHALTLHVERQLDAQAD